MSNENVDVELSADSTSADDAEVEELKTWGREHGLDRMRQAIGMGPLHRRAYRELVQEEKERYQPTEKRVRELLGAMPECPRTRGALEEVPESVKQEWRDAFIREFFRWYGPGSSLDLQECAKRAHHKASAMFRVERPETIEEARTIPEWKLLRRQELDFSDLPSHAQSEIRECKGRASGAYLEVFTIDGGQYFFEVPSAA
ncbi:MAG TPA: hypothetical protein VJR04_13005 [Terriglobales bacterium]|nr:hypothetical protein [Terriglobales bacterium]